jgi:hypothetical protein
MQQNHAIMAYTENHPRYPVAAKIAPHFPQATKSSATK